MKVRQFKQLANVKAKRRDELLIEGLPEIARHVEAMAVGLECCAEPGAGRASRLLYMVGREEAGKFLALLDIYRARLSQAELFGQLDRAADHLAKLLYAQIADYSIADYQELVEAVNRHRVALYLDGPNEVDFMFRNDLMSDREGSFYVDLVDAEGELHWWSPYDLGRESVPTSMRLAMAIVRLGLISAKGFAALRSSWADFDPTSEPNCWHWQKRTQTALEQFAGTVADRDPDWSSLARFVIDRWPMPMTSLDLTMTEITVADLEAERARAQDEFYRREFGDDEW